MNTHQVGFSFLTRYFLLQQYFQQHTCLSLHSVQSVSQVFVKLLAELTLATPAVIINSVNNRVLVSVSFVEACAAERCFIRSELFTTDVDKGD